jgi:Carboxypeptidase regulatory-like domain
MYDSMQYYKNSETGSNEEIVPTRRRMQIRVWMVGILVCACTVVANAQETRGSIVGQVRDTSGAVIGGVQLTAMNMATNVVFRATTDNDGAYQFPLIPPGTYTLTADATGFKKTQREHVKIEIHAEINVDFALEVGSLTERVTVTSDEPVLQTATANMGHAISSQDVTELPLSYGSVYETMFLTNGVSTFNDAIQYQDQGSIDGLGGSSVINGTPAGTEGFSIDGVNNRQIAHGQGPMTTPPADLIDSAKAETAYDASAGSSSGEVFNVALKSGTNTLHGSADFFDKPANWAANTFLGNMQGQPRGNAAYKRWGATLGGPVYIPKLYDGRNRTFFIYGYDAFNEQSPDGSISSVPTPAEVGGDFSALLSISPQYQIYDPATTQPIGNGRFSRLPFAGNIIPANRISPIATAMLKHYPAPNQSGNPDGSQNYGNSSHMSPGTMWSHTVKIDQFINAKQRLSGRTQTLTATVGPTAAFGTIQSWDKTFFSMSTIFLLITLIPSIRRRP